MGVKRAREGERKKREEAGKDRKIIKDNGEVEAGDFRIIIFP